MNRISRLFESLKQMVRAVPSLPGRTRRALASITPMFVLLLGLVTFFTLVMCGFIFEWPFGAGLLLMSGAFIFCLIWAFDGAGKGVQEMFKEQG